MAAKKSGPKARGAAARTASTARDGGVRWDPDVPAHNQTWMYLFLRGLVATSFPDSRHVKMSQMAWWNPAASPDVRAIDAQKVSIEMHRFFKDGMHRGYEQAFAAGFPLAIAELSATLAKADNTVPDLAATIDRVFLFENEAGR
jgi:hypothetical protein